MTFQQKPGVKGLQLVTKLWPSTPPKRVPNKAGYNQKNCKIVFMSTNFSSRDSVNGFGSWLIKGCTLIQVNG